MNGLQMDLYEVIQQRFSEFGFPLIVDRSIIPQDDSTLFICSGMQQVKDRRDKNIVLGKSKWKSITINHQNGGGIYLEFYQKNYFFCNKRT